MDLVRRNNMPQCRLGLLLVVLAVLLLLCGLSKSQILGDTERIGCIEANMTRTCFDVYNSYVNWSDAWSQCLAKGAQLALLSTPETNDLVGKYMDRITENLDENFPVWIAGRELNDSVWKWTNGEPFLARNVSTMSTLFSNQLNRYENCAANSQNGSVLVFQSSQCKNELQFICQVKYGASGSNTTTSTTTCRIAGNEGVVVNNSCYAVVSAAPLSWFKARHKCQTLGADLAVFNESSSSERDAIFSILPNDTTKLFWIGLRRNPWIWVTDYDLGANAVIGRQEISYAGWESTVPYKQGRSCLAMEGRNGVSHVWNNLKCDELHPFICHQITSLTTTAAPTTAPSLTTAFYDDGSDNTTESTPEQWYDGNIVHIVVPVVIVAVIILVIGVSIYCYFSQRRDGYVEQQ